MTEEIKKIFFVQKYFLESLFCKIFNVTELQCQILPRPE